MNAPDQALKALVTREGVSADVGARGPRRHPAEARAG